MTSKPLSDRQRHSPATIELLTPGTAEYRPVHGQAQVIAGGDRHQSLYYTDAGDEPQQSDKDRAERQHWFRGEWARIEFGSPVA